MTFRNWLNQNYNTLIQLTYKIDKEHGEELLHFTIDKFLCNGDSEFLDGLTDENKLKYVSRTLSLQSKSKSSQFYREYKKYTIITNNDILPIQVDEVEHHQLKEKQLDFIEDELNNMSWFSSLLFRRYVEMNYSAQQLADKLVIPLSTVQYHLKKVKTQIRNNWNNNKDLYI